MRQIMLSVLVVGFVFGLQRSGHAQDDARAIIQKAVQVHGGAANLERFNANRAREKGTVIISGVEIPFTAETTIQLPHQYRNIMHFQLPNMELTAVQVLNGENAWVSMNGTTEVPPEKVRADMREMLYMDQIVRLVPLLKDPNYRLTRLGDSQVNNRPAAVVRVSAKGFREVSLFFDKVSGLLVKTEHLALDETMKEVNREEYYSDFKEIDGIKRPTKVIAYKDGRKSMEGELLEFKHLEKLDDSEFAKPGQ